MDVLCTADLCPVILNSTCVFYEGNTLIYTGITTNDSIQTALQKIDAKFGDAMVGYTFTNGVFQSVAGAPVGLGGSLIANTSIGGNFTLTFAGNLQATKLVTTGGTASQFVKGDGTLDSTAYQAAGNYITALTGDVIANGPGSVNASLAVINSNPGTYGDSTHVARITVDNKGRLSAVTSTAIAFPEKSISIVGDVYGSGFTGSQTTLTLNNVNSNVYTNNTFLKFKVNAKGLVTGAALITHVDIEGVLGYVPTPETRKLSINGVQHDLQSDIYWTIATGVSGVTASAPLVSSGGAVPNISIPKATALIDGYLDNVDWVTFNSKQNAIPYTPADDALVVHKAGAETITGQKTFDLSPITQVGLLLKNQSATPYATGYSGISADGGNFSLIKDNGVHAQLDLTGLTANREYVFPNANGTLTLISDLAAYQLLLNGTGLVRMAGTVVTYDNTSYTPQTRTITINGTTYDLSANRSWSIDPMVYPSAGIAVSTGTAWGTSLVDNSVDWNTAYSSRITSATAPLNITGTTISISQAGAAANGFLSSTDWNTFNNKQASGNYITDLTGEATAVGPGSAAVTLNNAAVIGKVLSGVNITGGTIVATDSILQAFGKVQNQINSLVGGTIYQGVWNAATNTPTLTSGVGTDGHYYITNVAGTTNLDGITDWHVGDWAIFHDGVWQQVDNTDAVVSVNGFTGAVSLVTTDIPEGTNLYFTPLRARQAISLTTTGTSGAATYNDSTGVLNIPQYQGGVTSFNTRTGAITLTSLDVTNALTYTPVTNARTITINGVTYDLSANRTWSIDSMIYPAAGIAVSTGTAWGTSITDNSTNWNTAYTLRISSLTTTGSSGAATLASNVLNIPNYTLSGLGGVPSTRTITINSTAYDLSADRTWNVGTVTSVAALTIGTTGTDITSSVATSTTTPVITLNIPTASATNRGALSAADWTTFNSKQAALNGTGFVKISGTTISYDNSTYALDSVVVKLTGDQTIAGLKTFSGFALIENNLFLKQGSGTSFLPGYNVIDADSTGMIFGLPNTFTAHLNLASLTTQRSYILPNASGTLALTSDLSSYVPTSRTLTINGVTFDLSANRSWTIATSGGTVTSVAALTLGTTGTDLSSTVATGTTTPVITLNVPTASAANRGALSAADWTTFNSKQAALGGTGFVKSTAGTISYDTSVYLTTASAAATYAPLTGTGTSGTWGINITGSAGSAGSVTWANVSGKPSSIFFYEGFTLDANTMSTNASGFTYSVNAPYTGPIMRVGDGSYSLQLNAAYSGGGTGIAFRTRNGDAGTFNPWRVILNDANYTSYSPSLTGSGASGTWAVRITGFANAGSQRLYSTDAAYNYDSANPYFGFLTYDGTYWLFKVSPASPDRVRVYRSDTSALADNASSISSATGNNYNWTGQNYFVSNRNTSTDSAPLQAYSNNGSGAIMSFHRGGYYAVNFGLDSDNVMRIGGWSAGVNRWQLDMSGNMSTAGSYTSGGLIRVGASTNLYLDYNYGCSIVGVYSAYRFQGVFAMGDAYKLAIDGTSPGNLYGISWSHPNAGGQATYLNDHGMMVMVNGVTYSALSSNIWARGRVTANENVYSNSGWFYSNNNAGWYNNTYGQGLRTAKGNVTYGSIINIGENFNGYGGYAITNTYNTIYMQNSGGDHGFFRDGGGGGWSFFYHQNYNCAGIGTDATDPSYSLHIIKYGGSNTGWIIWSDRRIKENIKTIDNALDKVLSLRGVYYNKIDDPNKERCVGYIAQEVMEVVPELVVYSEELDIYNMNYGPMVAMLTEAIKEQQAQIEELKQQVQLLLNK